MTDSRTNHMRFDGQADRAPKMRECLRCHAKFESHWAGERICGRCKGSAAWRTGTPMHSPPTKRQR